MTKRFTILFLLFCTVYTAKSQDIHFTSYDFAPLTVNPALAGAFLGTYRVGGIYRDQWRSVSSDGAFQTANIHIDMPVIKGFRDQDWVGIGVNVYNDRSNSYNISTTKSFQGLSYHLSIDKKQTQIISFGIQNNTASTTVNRGGLDLRTETFILTGQSGENASVPNGTITDWVGGVMYSQYLRNQSFLRAGASLGNITGRSTSLIGNDNNSTKRKVLFNAFAMYDMPIAGNLFLTPQIFYQRKGGAQELLTQAKFSYLFNEAKGIFINAGLGARWGDSMNILLGVDIKDVKVQFAYDINTSGLSAASNSVGAFELGVSYIGKVYKKPKVDPTEVCPRF